MSDESQKMNTKLFNKDYILLVQGSLFSSFGYVLYSAAISYWVYEETGSTALMGVLASITMFVRMFLLPVAGTIDDHISRRNVIAGSDAVCGLCFTIAGILALTGRLGVPVIAFAAVVSGICGSLLQPAAASLLADLIPREEFIRGQSIFSGGNSLLQMAGQAMSGVLIVTFGAPLLIFINGICYFVSALTEIFIHNHPSHNADEKMNLPVIVRGFLSSGKDFLTDRTLLVFSAAVIILNFLCCGAYALLVAFTSQYGMTTQQYGYISAIISCGGLLGMLAVGVFKIPPQKRFIIMIVSYAIMGASCGAGFLVADFLPTCILFIIAFTFNGVGNGILGGCITLMLPEEKRSAMSGFFLAACICGDALSGVAYGFLTELFPLKLVCGLGQILTLIPLAIMLFDQKLKKRMGERKRQACGRLLKTSHP